MDAHAARESCALLTNHQAEKEKSSISPEDTPLYEAIRNIIDVTKECEKEQENQDNENIQKGKEERKAAEDMKLNAMGSLAESKAQKQAPLSDDDESQKNSKKRRSSGSDTPIFT